MLKRLRALFTAIPQLSPREAQIQLKQPHTRMLDVREPQERTQLAIPKTLHIPLSKLPNEMDHLAKEQHLIVQCNTGRRSQMAARMLQARGFKVSNLRGGLLAWQAQGLAVRKEQRS